MIKMIKIEQHCLIRLVETRLDRYISPYSMHTHFKHNHCFTIFTSPSTLFLPHMCIHVSISQDVFSTCSSRSAGRGRLLSSRWDLWIQAEKQIFPSTALHEPAPTAQRLNAALSISDN